MNDEDRSYHKKVSVFQGAVNVKTASMNTLISLLGCSIFVVILLFDQSISDLSCLDQDIDREVYITHIRSCLAR